MRKSAGERLRPFRTDGLFAALGEGPIGETGGHRRRAGRRQNSRNRYHRPDTFWPRRIPSRSSSMHAPESPTRHALLSARWTTFLVPEVPCERLLAPHRVLAGQRKASARRLTRRFAARESPGPDVRVTNERKCDPRMSRGRRRIRCVRRPYAAGRERQADGATQTAAQCVSTRREWHRRRVRSRR